MIGDPIALGIGTPSSIPVFLLVGLTPTGVLALLDICDTETVSLVEARRVVSLVAERETASLVPARRVTEFCS